MRHHERGRSPVRKRPQKSMAGGRTTPESTRPLPLTAASVEALSRADAAWFRRHPGEDVRYRPAGDREWPMLDRCPVPWPGASAVLMVEVTQLAPGVRTRRPYWVLGEAVA